MNNKNALMTAFILVLLQVDVTAQDAADSAAQQFDPVRVVNIIDEPRHRTVHRDGELRLIDVQINPGDTTLPHTHDSAILYTFISNGEGPSGGRVSSITSYVTEQYTHRVNNPGPGLFRIIALASYGAGAGALTGDVPEPPMIAELENNWFRSYRVELSPGQSGPLTTHTHPVAIVQVTDGLLHVGRADGITEELSAPGDWAWRNAGVSYQIHNRGEQHVTVVINEGRR